MQTEGSSVTCTEDYIHDTKCMVLALIVLNSVTAMNLMTIYSHCIVITYHVSIFCVIGWDIGPRRNELADTWIDHGAFNDTLVRKYMHPDTILIACVREPVSWFKSATKYFAHTRKYVSLSYPRHKNYSSALISSIFAS